MQEEKEESKEDIYKKEKEEEKESEGAKKEEGRKCKMECRVCFELIKGAPIECGTCKCLSCKDCQELSASPKCMGCQLVLNSNCLGPKLTKTLLKPWEENEFWKREDALLGNTQLLLDWEAETTRLKGQLRFGLKPTFPPKPKINLSGTLMFPCPSITCRGFVSGKGECGTCKAEVCIQCREIHEGKCNPQTLESIQVIQQDSKPCPKCMVLIFKTLGCDHMFCTHCRTHWHWETKKILKESSNGHYNTSPIFGNAESSPHIEQSQGRAQEECQNSVGGNLYVPHLNVPHTNSTNEWHDALQKAFTIERKQVLFAFQSVFNAEKIHRKHEEALLQVRLKFLRKEIDLSTAKRKVHSLEMTHEKLWAIHRLLYLNLEQTLKLWGIWYRRNWNNPEDIKDRFNVLQDFCNAQAQQLGAGVPQFLPLTLASRPLFLL
jgi:hypothetical protein